MHHAASAVVTSMTRLSPAAYAHTSAAGSQVLYSFICNPSHIAKDKQ